VNLYDWLVKLLIDVVNLYDWLVKLLIGA